MPWRIESHLSLHVQGWHKERVRDCGQGRLPRPTACTPRCVVEDLKHSLAGLERRILKLRRESRVLVDNDEQLREQFRLLIGVLGTRIRNKQTR
jgi:hypothetical protein